MSKRFTDTNKYKKPFIRSLQAPYKILWDYLYHDCDHAGIWIVDFEIAQIFIGKDAQVNKLDAIKYFNSDEIRVIEFNNGTKWFIPSFIEFQYGLLNSDNRAHNSVIQILLKHKLINSKYKPLKSPLQGGKDKDKDKDKDKEKGFDDFWELYHSTVGITKTDKDGCLKHWLKLTNSDRAKAIEMTPKYAKSVSGQELKYRKKARTYLSDKNFNDEFEVETKISFGNG